MSDTTPDPERTAFEAWAVPNGLDVTHCMGATRRYLYLSTADAWLGWQAGRASIAAPAWQSIETAPQDGSTILIAEDAYVDAAFWHDGSQCYGHRGEAGWFSEDDRNNLLTARNIHPTHWMAMPAPPAIKEDGHE